MKKSKLYQYIIAGLTASFVAGCGFFTDHESEVIRPEIASHWQYFEYDDIIKKNKKSISNIRYQNFFLNPEFVAMIDLALNNNKDLKIATLRAKTAFDYYRVKRGDLLPSVAAGANASRQKVSRNSMNRFGNNFQAANSFIVNNYEANIATASIELDLFNKLKYINESAFNDFLSKMENQNAVRTVTIGQAARSFINLQASEKIRQLAQEILTFEEEKMKIAKSKHENGLISEEEMLRASNNLQDMKSQFANLTKNTEQDKNNLINILGLADDNKIKSLDFNQIKLNDKSFIDISSEILLLRPDVVAAEFELYAMDANIKVARASYFPSISLTGSYGFVSNKFSNLISSDNSGTWSFGTGINIPIFSGFKNSANLERRKAEREMALANYQKTLQAAFKEVADLLATRKYNKNNLKATQEIEKSSQNIASKAATFFDIGSKNKIDLINSEQEHLQNKIKLIIAKQQHLNNEVSLYQALGAGMMRYTSTLDEIEPEVQQQDLQPAIIKG